MRIAFDATPLLGQGTGIATFTRGVFATLARRRDAELVAYGLTWRGRRRLADAVPDTARVINRPMPATLLLALWGRTNHPPAEWFTGPVDVVHGTNFVAPPTRRAAVVVSVHDLTAVHHPELCSPASQRYPHLIRRAVARGAFVHTHTREVAADIVSSLAVPEERVRVVPSGIDPPMQGDPVKGAQIAGGHRFVLALGTVEPRKGLPTLIAAFDELAPSRPELRLVIAGPEGWGEEDVARARRRSPVADRIVRLGYVEAADRGHLLAAASAFAYPSVYEGFGYPPLEAMAAGVPVVATTAGSLPEVLADGAALVPSGNPAALAEALATVLDDGAAADRARSAGRERAAAFTWDACVDGLVQLYRDAIAAGAPTRAPA